MSVIDGFRATVEMCEEESLLVSLTKERGRAILNEIDRMKELLKTIPFEEGDIVHEAGYPDEIGEVVSVGENDNGRYYFVRLNKKPAVLKTDTILYYPDEIELIERPS